MNRISLSVMLLVGIEASKEPFFVEAYKLTGDSACLFHRYGKRGSIDGSQFGILPQAHTKYVALQQ